MTPVEIILTTALAIATGAMLLAWRLVPGVAAGHRAIELALGAARGEPGVVEWADDGLAPGTVAPGFRLRTLSGDEVSLGELHSQGLPVVLVFTEVGCQASERLDPQLRRLASATRGLVEVATLISVPAAAAHASLAGADHCTLLDPEGETAERYLVRATPSAVLVDARGRLSSPLAGGSRAVRELLSMVAEAAGVPAAGAIVGSFLVGGPLPPFSAIEPAGTGEPPRATTVMHDGEHSLLLLLISPFCRHSMRLVPAIRVWEANRPADLEVVVISQGAKEHNAKLRLASRLVTDPYRRGFAAFDVAGTPAAVKAGPSGVVDAVAVGTGQVAELLGLDPEDFTEMPVGPPDETLVDAGPLLA